MILAAILAVAAAGVSAVERIAQEPKFQAQVATSAEQPPKASDWSVNEVASVRDARPPAGAAWTREEAKKANSQFLRRELTVPAGWTSGRISLDFDRINGNAILFLDGQRVGERPGPYGEIDITRFAKPGQKQELTIFNTRNYTDVSRTFETDPLRYTARGPKSPYGPVSMDKWATGINAPFYLVHRPAPAALASGWAETSFRKETVTLHAEVDAETAVKDARISVEIRDADGKPALAFDKTVTLKPGVQEIALPAKWENPILWELDRGYLYTAAVTLSDASGKVLDRDTFPFGFREVWTEGRNLMLNGHAARFRVEWASFGLNENSVSFFKLLGRNMIYFQSNPSGWWRNNTTSEVFNFPQETIDLCDREGIAVLLPVPTVNFGRERFLNDEALRKQYREETELFMRRYRNHPSILAWCLSMNAFNPKDAIHPRTMGKRSDYRHIQADVLEDAAKTVKSIDPTRLAYSHADGNLCDIATSNLYPNFAPLQETEDWPELWAKQGDMPFFACEFAAVYDGSYFKGKSFYLTEYAAIMLGPEAYQLETGKQLEETLKLGLNNRGHGQDMRFVAQYTPLYYEVQKRYVEAMDRAWRTWGVLGWHYFNFHLGYGDPPETKGYQPFSRYSVMTSPVTERPGWASPQFDYYAKNMQPLLAYLGGAPDHTDKTHSFYAGETVKKQFVAVWDGPGELVLDARWKLLDADGKTVESGKLDPLSLKPGDIRFVPVSFAAPEVRERSEYQLELDVAGYKTPVSDRFALQVFPKFRPLDLAGVRLYDPKELSGWVKTLIPGARAFQAGDRPNPGEILVFGRESLKVGDKLPFTAADIRNGLRVIFLEQKPEVWEAMGFRNYEPSSRQVFPLESGFRAADLACWRGKSSLLPEFTAPRAYDVPVAPKTSNRNTVATTVMEIPEAVGFVPLLACEFDMGYSPLLVFQAGKGALFYSSLDFTGRAGTDPAATEAARRLFEIAAKLPEAGTTPVQVHVNLPPEKLAAYGIATEPAKLRRVSPPKGWLASLLPPNLLRFRDEIACNRIVSGKAGDEIECDGTILVRKNGKGYEIFCQLAPELLEKKYAADPDKAEGVALSVVRLKQLVARLKSPGGENIDPAVLDRLLKVRRGAAYQDLDNWTVFGPFDPRTTDAKQALATEFPGEKAAVTGDLNPNITYQYGGRTFDFRTTATTVADHFLDLGRATGNTSGNIIAYGIREVDSPADRKATLRFGVDYFARVYVNGKLVYEQSTNHASPKPNQFRIRINLRKGANVIAFKVLSGTKGFGFWANLSEPEAENEEEQGAAAELLYDPTIKLRNPYEYVYW